jgi:hypothetical protein
MEVYCRPSSALACTGRSKSPFNQPTCCRGVCGGGLLGGILLVLSLRVDLHGLFVCTEWKRCLGCDGVLTQAALFHTKGDTVVNVRQQATHR